jgi:Fe-S cluster biosynthesis and repair protein YggX
MHYKRVKLIKYKLYLITFPNQQLYGADRKQSLFQLIHQKALSQFNRVQVLLIQLNLSYQPPIGKFRALKQSINTFISQQMALKFQFHPLLVVIFRLLFLLLKKSLLEFLMLIMLIPCKIFK